MKIFIALTFILLIISCDNNNSSKYVLEEKSQMAQLMLDMHSEMEEIQVKIKKGEDLGQYPSKYDEIVTAEMTDESMRDESWGAYANAVIEAKKNLYEAAPEEKEQAYQDVVNSCIACHTSVGCSGPIPKINKLHWKD
jgi:cytochrome c553